MSEQENFPGATPVAPDDSTPNDGELTLLRAVVRRDQQELENLRGQLLATSDTASGALRRLAETERRLEQALASIDVLEHSSSFRFGNALVRSVKSPRQLWQLPRTLWMIGRDIRRGSLVSPSTVPLPTRADHQTPAPLGELPRGLFDKPEGGGHAHRSAVPAPVTDLRVAAIMDEFTRACFMPTCRMQSLHAQHYEQQLLDNVPDLLLVESAWRGEANSWRNMVASRSGELLGLLDMCRRRNIPTAFWNKEDPSHFETFIETARLFDHVFTTDIDCIQRYRDALGHGRVHLLPFACQPRIHHPVYDGTRQPGFSFAGSYYHQYPERCQDFDRLLSAVSGLAPVVIYDRNSERGEAAFAFPERYAALLQPALPYERIDEAYKGYRFAINMNTIKQSQTMFARRVYELMACNTIVVSNYSRGMRSLFGDLAVATDQPQEMRDRLQAMVDTPNATRRLRLLALRKVLREHTYAQRMQYIARCVLGESRELPSPFVVAVARVHTVAQATVVLAAHRRQLHRQGRLLLVAADGLVLAEPMESSVDVIRESDAAALHPARDFAGHYLAMLHPHDYHGAHYLADLVLATRYSTADVIGKAAHYHRQGGEAVLVDGPRYRDNVTLQARACMVRCSALQVTLADWLNDVDVAAPVGLAIDEFSYCRDGAGHAELGVDVEAEGIDTGANIATVLRQAETLPRESDRAARRRPRKGEINAGSADFRAVRTRSPTLLIAESPQQLESSGAGDGDRFLYTESATRSFLEIGDGEVMQGDRRDLDDLLRTRSYTTICVQAPGVALCEIIAEHAAFHAVRIRLRGADIATADPPWLALLRAGYPRLRLTLDRPGAVDTLAAVLGRPLAPDLYEFD